MLGGHDKALPSCRHNGKWERLCSSGCHMCQATGPARLGVAAERDRPASMVAVIKEQPMNTGRLMPAHLPGPTQAGTVPPACCLCCYPPDPWRLALTERLCQVLAEDRQSVVSAAREPCNEGQMSGNEHRDAGTEIHQSISEQRECQSSASQMSAAQLHKYTIPSSIG